MRALRRSEKPGRYLRISGCDPLNLAGIITPGPRVPAVPGNRLVYLDGTPVAAVENGQPRMFAHVDAPGLRLLDRLLDERPASAFDPPLDPPGGPES